MKVSNHLLIEIWTCNIFQKIFETLKRSNGSECTLSEQQLDEAISLSLLGLPVWDDEYFFDTREQSIESKKTTAAAAAAAAVEANIDDVMSASYCGTTVPDGLVMATASSSSLRGDTCSGNHDINQKESSNSKASVRLEKNTQGEAIEEQFIFENKKPLEILKPEILVERRKRKTTQHGRLTAMELFNQLSKWDVHPHLLVSPHIYGEAEGAGAYEKQPFLIKVHPQVGLLSDVHSHLCAAEIIGLLAGRWDSEKNTIFVQSIFPCTSTERQDDDGSTDVELDPVAELEVREVIHDLGLQVVGWYHSHPQFRPDPSVTDIRNQQQYQKLINGGEINPKVDECTDPNISEEDTREKGKITHRTRKSPPFVGLIISAWDSNAGINGQKSEGAVHRWFHTKPYIPLSKSSGHQDGGIELPMLLDVIYRFSGDFQSEYDEMRDINANVMENVFQSFGKLTEENNHTSIATQEVEHGAEGKSMNSSELSNEVSRGENIYYKLDSSNVTQEQGEQIASFGEFAETFSDELDQTQSSSSSTTTTETERNAAAVIGFHGAGGPEYLEKKQETYGYKRVRKQTTIFGENDMLSDLQKKKLDPDYDKSSRNKAKKPRPSKDEVRNVNHTEARKQRVKLKVKQTSKYVELESSSSTFENNNKKLGKCKEAPNIKLQEEKCFPMDNKEKKLEKINTKKKIVTDPPLTLIECIQGNEQHSIVAKDILFNYPAHTRMVMLTTICFAFYYSRHKRRIPLSRLWGNKPQISRLEKMCQSMKPWFNLLGFTDSDRQDKLIDSIHEIFTCLWAYKS